MKTLLRLISVVLWLSTLLALPRPWGGTGVKAQTPGAMAWPRAGRPNPAPTPMPTPPVTTSTLAQTRDQTSETQAQGAAQPPAPAEEQMVPLEIKLPKPMFVGTPRDIHTPNLESYPSVSYAPPPPPMFMASLPYCAPYNTESYGHIRENAFQRVGDNPLSTFSIDVDTASYAIVRAMMNVGRVPPRDAVRVEELINYFTYHYPPPREGEPFAVSLELAQCPWAPAHKLARIGLKGRELDANRRPDSNLVFLIDVSGSMDEINKLPLVKRAMLMLLDRLGPRDHVAIVVYASESGMALEPMACDETGKKVICKTIEELQAGGLTQGSAGIQLAYELAARHFIKDGTNRVILCTDGDFNVGITTPREMGELITYKARSGIFLTLLGFGMGNLQDRTMETLADKGNGNYGYIDTIGEARKVLGQCLSGTLVTIAKDVKIQVEFNPLEAASWRLIGYEDRKLNPEDFNNDKKDAGEIGAGHTVTALYEIVSPDMREVEGPVDVLKYQTPVKPKGEAGNGELLTVKLRFKTPEGTESRLATFVLRNGGQPFERASEDFRFAAAVASFGMILRESPHRGQTSLDRVIDAALDARGSDANGEREEFISLARQAKELLRPGQ